MALRSKHLAIRHDADGRPVLLVLRALGVGDLLTAVPALRALADAFPDHRRMLAAPAALRPLVELSHTVDALVPAGALEHLSLTARPAVAVNLHGRGPQSHAVVLATRPDRVIAFTHAHVPESRGHPTWRPGEHEVRRWCRLLQEEGVSADPERLDLHVPACAD